MLLGAFERMAASERGREAILRVGGPLAADPVPAAGLSFEAPPYAELPQEARSATSLRSDIVFITARFRSGSTLLWNLFRQVPGVTAYYEPFNERRWFDPARRGERVDGTHRQVTDYWREYDGMPELAELYDEDWIRRDLYMAETAWNPRMKRYIEALVERAPGRPVLQFNRVDFRLPWLRKQFPNAKIVHLFRHPRDQWCSTLADPNACGPSGRMANFADGFYLLAWARDLQVHFPFLRPEGASHPYELYYLIWRLSFMFGRGYADHSVCFESLLDDPQFELASLFSTLDVQGFDLPHLTSLLSPPAVGKWREYASDAWFRTIEERCESMLAEFFQARQTSETLSGLTAP
jgi:hypothetical protein